MDYVNSPSRSRPQRREGPNEHTSEVPERLGTLEQARCPVALGPLAMAARSATESGRLLASLLSAQGGRAFRAGRWDLTAEGRHCPGRFFTEVCVWPPRPKSSASSGSTTATPARPKCRWLCSPI